MFHLMWRRLPNMPCTFQGNFSECWDCWFTMTVLLLHKIQIHSLAFNYGWKWNRLIIIEAWSKPQWIWTWHHPNPTNKFQIHFVNWFIYCYRCLHPTQNNTTNSNWLIFMNRCASWLLQFCTFASVISGFHCTIPVRYNITIISFCNELFFYLSLREPNRW